MHTRNPRIFSASLVLSVSLLFLLLVANSTNATTIIVVTTTEHELNIDDDCSLREAITAANMDISVDACPAGSGADVIELETGAVYTVDDIDNETYGPNGLPIISSPITFEGNGAIIERNSADNTPAFRLMQITRNGAAELVDLTLRNGYLTGDLGRDLGMGSALLNYGSTILRNVNISNNSGQRSYNQAVATRNDVRGSRSTFHVVDSIFENNYRGALVGSWYYDGGTISVEGTVFTNNGNLLSGTGGAIFLVDGCVHRSTTNIIGSTFASNYAHDGGAIDVDCGDVSISDSVFTGNSATRSGGAMKFDTEGAIIRNSIFVSNTAGEVGGTLKNGSIWPVDITGASFVGNTAPNGGAIYNWFGDLLSITDSIFSGNEAIQGSAVFNHGNDRFPQIPGHVSVHESCIFGNSSTAVYNHPDQTQTVAATDNWWGAADGPSGTGLGSGDAVNANVNYSPFLTGPAPACAPPTPEEQIQEIEYAVTSLAENGVINHGQENSLLSVLDAATRRLDKGNTNAACNLLGAFSNHVQALVNADVLSPIEGQILIDAGRDLTDELCGT